MPATSTRRRVPSLRCRRAGDRDAPLGRRCSRSSRRAAPAVEPAWTASAARRARTDRSELVEVVGDELEPVRRRWPRAWASTAAPRSRKRVEQRPALGQRVEAVLGAGHEAHVGLERPGEERLGIEVGAVGRRGRRSARGPPATPTACPALTRWPTCTLDARRGTSTRCAARRRGRTVTCRVPATAPANTTSPSAAATTGVPGADVVVDAPVAGLPPVGGWVGTGRRSGRSTGGRYRTTGRSSAGERRPPEGPRVAASRARTTRNETTARTTGHGDDGRTTEHGASPGRGSDRGKEGVHGRDERAERGAEADEARGGGADQARWRRPGPRNRDRSRPVRARWRRCGTAAGGRPWCGSGTPGSR